MLDLFVVSVNTIAMSFSVTGGSASQLGSVVTDAMSILLLYQTQTPTNLPIPGQKMTIVETKTHKDAWPGPSDNTDQATQLETVLAPSLFHPMSLTFISLTLISGQILFSHQTLGQFAPPTQTLNRVKTRLSRT